MTNLDKIKAMEDSNLKWILWAWAMGWSAEFIFEERKYYVVSILGGRVVITETGRIINAQWMQILSFKITGYKYAGQLAGNEKPSIEQKFMIKETGKTIELSCYLYDSQDFWHGDSLQYDEDEHPIDKSEITPIFT